MIWLGPPLIRVRDARWRAPGAREPVRARSVRGSPLSRALDQLIGDLQCLLSATGQRRRREVAAVDAERGYPVDAIRVGQLARLLELAGHREALVGLAELGGVDAVGGHEGEDLAVL